MKTLTKAIALMLTACLLTGATFTLAFAEGTSQTVATPETAEVTQAVPTTLTLNDTDVVARVNGTDVTGTDVKKYYSEIVGYYGEPTESTIDVYYAIAMEQAVIMKLVNATAVEKGLDQYTEEEKATIYKSADDYWQAALENYATSTGAITDTSTEEQKTAAYTAAEAYYNGEGYSRDKLREQYLQNSTYQRVQDFVCKDVTVTDQDVQTDYDTKVAADKALYENDVNAYETTISTNKSQNSTEVPLYHPAGYRYVRHILLPVDATLMAKYTDLQARLEEQMDTETAAATDAPAATDASAVTEATAAPTDTADPAATAEPTQEPVTQADLDNAKAEILASLSAKITEINDKIKAGQDFNALIAEYGVKADGSASDPGMTSNDYPNGYEVSQASTTFVPEFVQAAFSVNNVGDVSAPFISSYGVHIVKYMGDVPAGPVELTDTLKESLRTALLTSKRTDAMTAWQKAATVEYTGILKSIEQIQAEMNTGDEASTDATATEAPATDAAATEAPATDTAATDAPVTEPTAAPAQ